MKTIIIIIGASKSGSTLLAKTLGGHSKCFTLGEINRYNSQIDNPEGFCGCGALISECEFWKTNAAKIEPYKKEPNNEKFDVGIFKQITTRKELLKLFPTVIYRKKYRNHVVEKEVKNTLNLYNIIFDQTKNEVLIDSTKGLFRALILDSNKTEKLNFHFVHLIRDGRGVLNSSQKKSYFIKHADGKIKEYKKDELAIPIYVQSPKESINYWLYVNIRNYLILKFFRKSQTSFVKYENFTANPEKIIRHILKNCNLDFEPNILNLELNDNHILGGNSSRINAKKIKRQDDAWKTNLSKKNLRHFNLKAGWFNKLIGYK